MTSQHTDAGAQAPRRVLVVEDDRTINDALCDRLRAEGFIVHAAYDGPGGVAAAGEHDPEVVLLDVMLPGFDGHEVCRRIQAERPMPVLMLTARDDETDVLVGLGVGADDYLTKPFRMREVVARTRALLRRVDRATTMAAVAATTDRRLASDGVSLDQGTREVEVDGAEVHLTRTEFDLLVALLSRPGQVRRREQLLAEVWDWDAAGLDGAATRTVDSHVRSLRTKVGAERIRTVVGVGYAWARRG